MRGPRTAGARRLSGAAGCGVGLPDPEPLDPPRLIVLRGPFGVGKTTVARALAERLGAGTVSIDRLLERFPWDGGSESLFLRTNRPAARRARALLARGRSAIVEGNFYWPSAIDDLVARVPYPSAVLTLRAPLAVCLARDRARRVRYGASAARAVFRKVGRVRRGTSIDARGPLHETVERIRIHLARGAGGRPRGRGGRRISRVGAAAGRSGGRTRPRPGGPSGSEGRRRTAGRRAG
jgi:predicted kinase